MSLLLLLRPRASTGAVVVVVGRFDRPTPNAAAFDGATPNAAVFDTPTPNASTFDPPSPG